MHKAWQRVFGEGKFRKERCRRIFRQKEKALTCELLTSCTCCSASRIFTYHLILLSNASQITKCALCHGRHGAAHPVETKSFGTSVAGKSQKWTNAACTCVQQQNRNQSPAFIYLFLLKNAFIVLSNACGGMFCFVLFCLQTGLGVLLVWVKGVFEQQGNVILCGKGWC